MWKSLIWKEWREQRWKLGFGCVLLLTLTFVGLRTRIMPDNAMIGLVAFFGAILLPLLNSMGLVAAERDEGSFNTLIRLPIPAMRIYIAKTVMGALVIVAPIFASAAIAWLIAGGREITSAQLIGLFLLTAAGGISVFLWTSVAAMRQPTEARGAIAGVIVMGVWLLAMALVVILTSDEQHWLITASPLGWLALYDVERSSAWMIVLVQLLILSALWLWGLGRFARPLKGN